MIALAGSQRYVLAPFSRAEVEVMLADATGDNATSELVDVVYENSEGMPAYLTEVM